jgi:hypothetical protein
VVWIDDGAEDDTSLRKRSQCREGMYVRGVGAIKAIEGGRRTIVCYHISPIADSNEITCHILDVIHASLRATQGSNQVRIMVISAFDHINNDIK